MQLIDRLKERLIVPEPSERVSPNGIDRERRRRIVLKMADPATKHRHEVNVFVRKVMRFNTLTEFLDNADLADVNHVERLLGI